MNAKSAPSKASILLAADLRRRIVSGELQAGDALPVEDALMESLVLSRSVVREALRILETEGLIVVRRGIGGGASVRRPTIRPAAQAMGSYLQLGDVLVIDVWEARDRIIGSAVERLAKNHSDADAVALIEAAERLASVVGNLEGYYPELIAIGETVVQLAGNTTEYMLVVALRHVIAADLEQATRAIIGHHAELTVETAVAREADVARAWAEVAFQVKGGHPRSARRAYNLAVDPMRENLAKRNTGRVVDIFRRL